jgi:hypothetical protein
LSVLRDKKVVGVFVRAFIADARGRTSEAEGHLSVHQREKAVRCPKRSIPVSNYFFCRFRVEGGTEEGAFFFNVKAKAYSYTNPANSEGMAEARHAEQFVATL